MPSAMSLAISPLEAVLSAECMTTMILRLPERTVVVAPRLAPEFAGCETPAERPRREQVGLSAAACVGFRRTASKLDGVVHLAGLVQQLAYALVRSFMVIAPRSRRRRGDSGTPWMIVAA
jgi:hypothetical protein